MIRVAEEEGLPLAIKVGAVRGANPALRAGGDLTLTLTLILTPPGAQVATPSG